MRVLLVPSLRLEDWRAMDRYSRSLTRALPHVLPRGWTTSVLPSPAYPSWVRFPARWLAYPRTIDWKAWDVVHVLDHSYAHMLHRRRPGVRTVLTVHDLYAFDRSARKPGIRGALLDRVNRWVLAGARAADVCMCDSRATLHALTDQFPELEPRARWEPLGVDGAFFVPDAAAARRRGRRLLGIDDGAMMILHVGSCEPRKGMQPLLRALARLPGMGSAVRFVQVGGRFRPEDVTLIQSLDLAAAVRQQPFVPEEELPAVYAAADVLVMPSFFEGFGFPILEAFAVGVPVVATRNTSLADFPATLLESAGSGSVDELEQALSRMLRDPARAADRAAAARRWARDYTWHRVARAAADAYGAGA